MMIFRWEKFVEELDETIGFRRLRSGAAGAAGAAGFVLEAIYQWQEFLMEQNVFYFILSILNSHRCSFV